ncbi:MAG TPA: hypothetical protein VGL42_04455 [Opitutaceae bacterium]
MTASHTFGCACGCGIYEVGTSAMMPTDTGPTAYLDFDYQDQNQNWSGDSAAPAANNDDKDIRTSWYTFGYQQMFSREWGLRIDLPYEERHFVTTGGATGDQIVAMNFRGFSDARIEGIYTGLSADLSTGLMFGLKLPSGSYRIEDAYNDIDRDTEIGTGSTDLLLGGYHRFFIANGWDGFAQVMLDVPALTQAQYRPGMEFDASVGTYFHGFSWGLLHVSPLAQLKLALRDRDHGAAAANPIASGYARLFAGPGLEVDWHPWMLYAAVQLPFYQDMRGNQLIARVQYQMNVSYRF